MQQFMLWDKKRSDEIRSQIGMRKLDKQIHKRKKIDWKIYSRCHQKELQTAFMVSTDRKTQGQEEDGLISEDGNRPLRRSREGSATAQACSRRRPGFEPRSGHVGFMVDKVVLGQVFSECFGFPYQFSFHRLHHTHHLSSGAGTIDQLVADVPSGLSLTPPQENYVTWDYLSETSISVRVGSVCSSAATV
jgi:hypothetical protein